MPPFRLRQVFSLATLVPRRERPRPRSRPQVEALEDRLVLSVFTVNTTSDTHAVNPNVSALDSGGHISLRSAIEASNTTAGPNTINVPAGDYQLELGELDVGPDGGGPNRNTSIVGTGTPANTTIEHDATGTTDARVLNVNFDSVANYLFSLSNVTLAHGRSHDGIGGGGILAGSVNGGNAYTVTNVVFSDNKEVSGSTAAPGGAISVGGGDLMVTNCDFESNDAGVSSGGAIWFDTFGAANTLTVSGSTFNNNTAQASGGGDGGGAIHAGSGGTAVYNISTSTFAGNQVTAGDASGGGAIFAASGTLTVSDCNFVNNATTTAGPGQTAGGAIYSGGSLIANYNRLVGNTAIVHANGDTVFNNASGTANVADNWWGKNTGPAANAVVGTSVGTFLKLRNSASPGTINTGDTTTLTADLRGRSDGTTIAASHLVGLPAFPVPPGTIFSNAVKGTLSGASTQFVDGIATATFTAGGVAGTGSADATADNQTVTATITITAPSTTVVSITRAGSSPTNASSVSWTVTFADALSGLSASNFSLVKGGGLGGTPAITSVGPGGTTTTWTVTASTGTGSGTLRLDMVNDTGLSRTVSNLPFMGETYTIDRTAPTVISTVLDSGFAETGSTTQRSMVRRLIVTFSKLVTYTADAFSVLDVATNAPILGTLVVSASGGGTTTATITFTGAGIIGGSLADGRYQLIVNHTKVFDLAGNPLSGNTPSGDYSFGGTNLADKFFRLFGDANGDGVVDATDKDAFIAAYRSRTGMAAYRSYFDYDLNGTIDSSDLFQFTKRYGKHI